MIEEKGPGGHVYKRPENRLEEIDLMAPHFSKWERDRYQEERDKRISPETKKVIHTAIEAVADSRKEVDKAFLDLGPIIKAGDKITGKDLERAKQEIMEALNKLETIIQRSI